MTDNLTNEPTEAMILAGLNAYSSKGLELDGYETTEEYPSLEMWGGRFASQMRAALVAAQGAAPQAECDCGAGPGSAVCKKVCATRGPVLPSSTVDRIDISDLPAPVLQINEDALAEVLLKHSPSATDSGGFAACRCDRTWRSREGNAAHLARAVAERLKEQGR